LNLKRIEQPEGYRRRAARTLALVPVLLFLFLFVLATSPALHLALHADAGHADHHCAIKVLAQGQLESPAPDVFVFIAAKDVNDTLPVCLSVPGNAVELLPPGRAPPVRVA